MSEATNFQCICRRMQTSQCWTIEEAAIITGGQQLIARAAKDGSAIVLEIWKGSRVVRELHVPKDLHGSIYNDNWFSQEPSWNADETRIAYVAEVAAQQSVQHNAWLPASLPYCITQRHLCTRHGVAH